LLNIISLSFSILSRLPFSTLPKNAKKLGQCQTWLTQFTMFTTHLLRRCLCSSSFSNVNHQPHVLLKFWWDTMPSSFVPCGSLLVGLLPLVIAHCHFPSLSLVVPFRWACFHWSQHLLLVKCNFSCCLFRFYQDCHFFNLP
jgi:hypothetical protein